MPVVIKPQKSKPAKVVLLPGDPERAIYVAKKFLKNPVLYTKERFMFGYTGKYKDIEISVQTTGMGIPSISIIIEELVNFNVRTMIRIGTAGAISTELKLNDLVIATAAHSMSNMWKFQFSPGSFSAVADMKLISKISDAATKLGIRFLTGSVLTSDFLYEESEELLIKYSQYNTLAVEMETYGLFSLAAKRKFKAASILTISNTLFEKKENKLIYKIKWADKNNLKKGIDSMIELALETIYKNYDYLISH